jgi:hypothetical protein
MEENFIEIPLLQLSSIDEEGLSDFNGDWMKGKPTRRIQVGRELASVADCYGVLIDDQGMDPVLSAGMIALFKPQADKVLAKENIFSIGIRGQVPLIRKVLKKDHPGGEGKSGSRLRQASRPVRKSFMTPTPLHIPGSRVSPIDDKTHEMILIKSLEASAQVQVIPTEKILWMHPLVGVVNPNDEEVE